MIRAVSFQDTRTTTEAVPISLTSRAQLSHASDVLILQVTETRCFKVERVCSIILDRAATWSVRVGNLCRC